MSEASDDNLERLWDEYRVAFQGFDDLSLIRWMAQTLSQLQGSAWRLSHPLVGVYRLAAQVGHERQVWLKRLFDPPPAYDDAPCCRAPLVPLLTRDVLESGLVCPHCAGTAVAFEDIVPEAQNLMKKWAEEYAAVHAVAHWEESERSSAAAYEEAYENAGEEAERLLVYAGKRLVPILAEFYPAVIWEDQDDCLEVRPEDITL